MLRKAMMIMTAMTAITAAAMILITLLNPPEIVAH